MRSHYDQLSFLVASLIKGPMILALCETWLTDNDPTILYSFDVFSKNENVNRKNKKGDRLAFFVRKGFDFRTRVFVNPLEHFVISIIDNNAILYNFCLIYRAPSTNLLDFWLNFDMLLNELKSLKGELCIMGDFNIDILFTGAISLQKTYRDLLADFDLEVQNSEATRVTLNSITSSDHIISTTKVEVNTICCNVSDHYALLTEVKINSKQTVTDQQKLQLRNIEKLKNSNKIVNFLFLLQHKLQKLPLFSSTCNETLLKISEIMLDTFDVFAPLHYRVIKKSSWVNGCLKNLCRYRDYLHKKMVEIPSEQNQLNYKKVRNEVKKRVRESKRQNFDKHFSNCNDNKQMFQIFNTFCGKKERIRSN